MTLTLKQFRQWGATGARLRWRRLSKARRRKIANAPIINGKKKYYVPNGKPCGPRSKVNAEETVSMYKSGKTLAEIGLHFKVSRERIRQILSLYGITKEDGGSTIKQLLKIPDKISIKEAAQEKRERKARKVWGISHAEYCSIVDQYGSALNLRSPLAKYKGQRNSAHYRKIAWNISFSDWWRIWKESGHWEEMGRGQGKYVMARWGDTDGYSVDNVKIIPAVENNSDQLRKKSTLPMGVRMRGKSFTWSKMIGGKKYRGPTFSSAEEAHAAYLAFNVKRRGKR